MTARRALVAAAVLTAAPAAVPAAIINVTSVTTKMVVGPTAMVTGDKGTATPGTYSGFTSSQSYNVSFGGQDNEVTSVTGGGITYKAGGMATAVTRRLTGTTNNNDQLWYIGSGNASSKTLTLNGPELSSFNTAFASNNLNLGADNLFSNTGNAVGNNSNVTRLDLVFPAFKASNLSAFTIFDRGPSNDHDSFKIAAITAVDANGNPTNYGPLLSYSDGTWGTTNIVNTTEELILRKNDSSSAPIQPSDVTDQGIGGVIVPTSLLETPGTTIYGYSLFSPDVTGSGTELTQWTNTKYFPLANSTSTGGGLDPAATVAVLFTASPAAVPEPASIGMVGLAAAGLLGRRARRRAV